MTKSGAGLGAAGLAAVVVLTQAAFGTARAAGDGSDHPAATAASTSPQEALHRLMDGNQRFVAGKPTREHQSASWRAGLRGGQHPFATILGCSDSRVPVEMIFDQGFGQLFVVRVAGNVAADDEQGSIDYAVVHLHIPLVVVLGHEQCGAVTAALGSEADRKKEPEAIQALLGRIDPALKALPPEANESARVQRAIEANVRQSVQQLRNATAMGDRIRRGELNVVGAVYELETGRIRWLKE